MSRSVKLRFSRSLTTFVAIIFLANVFPTVLALRTSPNSPCADVCGTSTNTTTSQKKGQAFEKCVSCLLESSYADRTSGNTDVNWGLYNLRYAVSECVFGYPDSFSNISSPCPVSCEPIRPAVETNMKDPSPENFNSWCGTSTFADNVVNSCEFCYNLTATQNQKQVYLANYLESIRYNCHFETVTGSPFDIAPSRIFTSVLLPSSMSLSTPSASNSGVNLPLVIALPIIGFLVILIGLSVCCFFFIRWRRKSNRRGRHQSHMWNTPQSNQQSWAAEEMYAAGFGGGVGHGLGFVDTDGRGHEVGYGYDYSDQPSASQFPQQYADHTSYSEYSKGAAQQQITEDIPLQSPPIPQPYSMQGGLQSPPIPQPYAMQGGLQTYDPDQKRPL
ncbi:hypothetical protein N7509_002911 [Penicillium cosmopolitanum]|uniref:LPXTG-domain-containing protein n=1 Tax=Penicillium cosmopolitanum TaxID=1131564 RepID=A0A9W9WA53_9EURO|nr:uncharacterized protein N7509_002911 [Penicillium cosmopolitanum]KAJ5409028.1 hypothetical protein N7509_002911 [Penicillium cosmopolitanum]